VQVGLRPTILISVSQNFLVESPCSSLVKRNIGAAHNEQSGHASAFLRPMRSLKVEEQPCNFESRPMGAKTGLSLPIRQLRPTPILSGGLSRRQEPSDTKATAPLPYQEAGQLSQLVGMVSERAVYNVPTFCFGLGRTSVGLARIRDVFWSSQCWQGWECGSSPTSGTVFPQVRGLLVL
jgi:hypothetical protein